MIYGNLNSNKTFDHYRFESINLHFFLLIIQIRLGIEKTGVCAQEFKSNLLQDIRYFIIIY